MKQNINGKSSTGVVGAIIRYAPSRFIEPLLGLISIPILTHNLSAAQYGNLSIVLITVAMLRVVFFDWINNCALRFRRSLSEKPNVFFTNLLVGLATSALAMVIIILSIKSSSFFQINDAVYSVIILVLINSAAMGFVVNAEMIFRADERPVSFTLLRVFASMSRHVLGIIAILVFGTISSYLMAAISGVIIVGAIAWTSVGAWKNIEIKSFSWDIQKEFFRFGMPMSLVLIATQIQIAGNRYIVMSFDGPDATGLYSAAFGLGLAPIMVFQQVVMLGLYPLAINLHENGKSIQPIVRDGLRYFFLGAPVVLLIIVFHAPYLLSTIAGPEYVHASAALRLLSLGSFLYGLSQYFALDFLISKRTKTMAKIGLMAAIVNIIVSLLLVRLIGFVGAAIGAMVAHGLILIASATWGIRPTKVVVPWPTVKRVTMSLVPASLLIVFFKYISASISDIAFFVASTIAVFLLYVLALWFLGELKNDILKLKER
ncbi:MAG: polysaccharide biosynthesis protein [bacterium]|nr:polysaccharide biosynthesis protein [bacterium]